MSVSRAFGEAFTPLQWEGVRARQFTDEADAFQQLIGDALRGECRDAAIVSTTRGKDGSIDAWLRQTETLSARFRGFSLPLIVECKQHDAAANLAKNIDQGWSGVADKLARQAAAGWPGNFSPWKHAHGYLYCISARLQPLSAREALEQRIRDFFASLPDAQRPPIIAEQIRVWDWGQLAD